MPAAMISVAALTASSTELNVGAQGSQVLWIRRQADPDFRDDGECAFAAAEQAGQIE